MKATRGLLIAALLVFVSLFVVASASAERGRRGGHGEGPGEGPCKADVERLCGDVEPGEGRVHECLASQASQVSAECAQGLAKAEEHRAKRQAFKDACGADVERLCGESLGKGNGKGKGHAKGKGHGKGKEIMECLSTHEAELSPECQAQASDARAHHEARKAKHEALKTACKADVETFCADEAAEKGPGKRERVRDCMEAHERQLSGECQAAIQSARPQ